jgi:type IV secretory pathway TrbD component
VFFANEPKFNQAGVEISKKRSQNEPKFIDGKSPEIVVPAAGKAANRVILWLW